MEAIIMAGGEGSRLRPLTCDLPKPMARLCGKPALCYILDLLDRHGISKATLTLQYQSQYITSYFEEEKYQNLSLQFMEEPHPLGTAGSVKYACPHTTDDILVISGDALCDVDLTAAIRRHRDSHADATLIVTPVDDPREYGLVVQDAEGRITEFVEKPGWEQARVNAANTGIYLLSPRVLERIPSDQPYDFGRDLFPRMLQDGCRLMVYETKDYWCDIGDLDAYRTCQLDLLKGRVHLPLRQSSPPAGDYTVIEPVFFGQRVSVGKGAVIGPGTVIDDGVCIGAMARVKNSVLLQDSYVGEGASLSGSILCESASVKRSAQLLEGSIVGSHSIVGEYAQIMSRIRIWPDKEIRAKDRVSENLRQGTARRRWDDADLYGEAGVELSALFCTRVGCAAGSVKNNRRVGIAYSGDRVSRTMAQAVMAGLTSTGAKVWDFGAMLPTAAAFSAGFCDLPVTLYLSGGPRCEIRLLGEGGLPPRRSLERELETLLNNEAFTRCSWDAYEEPADMTGMRLVYQQMLCRTAPKGLVGCAVRVRSGNSKAAQMLETTLMQLGCRCDNEDTVFNLTADGTSLTIRDAVAGYLTWDKVVALNGLISLVQGEDIAVSYDAPRILDTLAEKYGRRVLRYVHCPTDRHDDGARQLAVTQPFFRDGMAAAIRLLHFCNQQHTTLAALLHQLPEYATVIRNLDIDVPVGQILSKLEGVMEAKEGVLLTRRRGSLLVRPIHSGRQLQVFAEAHNMEIAQELCKEAEDWIMENCSKPNGKSLDKKNHL